MGKQEGKYYPQLVINQQYSPISEEQAAEYYRIQKDFFNGYIAHREAENMEVWLFPLLMKHLPHKTSQEVQAISQEIIDSTEINNKALERMRQAKAQGMSAQRWFAKDGLKEYFENVPPEQVATAYHDMDSAVTNANDEFTRLITTKAGTINANPNLNGYLAEQYHAATFNSNAATVGSEYTAAVIPPNGIKEGVDIVIKDGSGNVVETYQVKYGQNADATKSMFGDGYKGQTRLVPKEQAGELNAGGGKYTDVLKSPDGKVTSTPLSKEDAKGLQKDAQTDSKVTIDYNDINNRKIFEALAKHSGQAAILGAAVGGGLKIAEQVLNGEEIDEEEVIVTALETGMDSGVKVAATGALKVSVEKGIIACIPKGTPIGIISSIAVSGIEAVKTFSKVASGKLTAKEGIMEIGENTCGIAAGGLAAAKGAAAGAALGMMLGPAGAAVGGLVGGAAGYMAGNTFGKTVFNAARKVVSTVTDVAANTVRGVGNLAGDVLNFVGGLFS